MLTIYKASAGSGKTFQLALHYLKMVLGVKSGPDSPWRLNRNLLSDKPSQMHRHILAITFTNKATEEMVNRIINSLNDVANADNEKSHPYIAALMDEFDCTFDDLRTAASRALVSLLIDFSFFHVSTIDSFFQTVLRTFARELGIQGDYNIEISPDDPIRIAVNLMFDDLDTPSAKRDKKLLCIFRWMEERASETTGKYTPYKRSSRSFTNLVDMVKLIFAEDFKPLQEVFKAYLSDENKLRDFTARLDEIISETSLSMIEAAQHAKNIAESIEYKDLVHSYTLGLLKKSAEGNFEGPETKILTSAIEGDEDSQLFKYKKPKSKKTAILPSEEYMAAMRKFAEALRNNYSRYRTARSLKRSIPAIEFIGLMFDYLDKARTAGNFLILGDTASHIARVIGHTEVPFIYEHLGSHLRHFLIDEFQDTSRLQWQNLFPLVSNSHDEGYDSLIIGDVKQAIYRFRNSDPSILGNDLENIDFPDHDRLLMRGQSEDDNCNYRTAHGIVKFNNTVLPVFASLALGVDAPDGYCGTQVRQKCAPHRAHLPSTVELIPYSKTNGSDAEYDISGDLLVQPLMHNSNTKIKVIIDRIIRQHDERHYKWSDIAILFRRGNNIGALIEELVKRGIPLQSQDNLFINNASSVKLLVSLLAMMAQVAIVRQKNEKEEVNTQDSGTRYTDHMAFETRYNYFLHRHGSEITPQEAIDLALADDDEIAARYSADASEAPSGVVLDILRSILDRHPSSLIATVEAILAEGLVPKKIILEEKDYMAAFIDLVVDYGERMDNDLNGFLRWWDDHKTKANIIPPADCDAVRVMSIHRAKGLEFKCVHLIDFDWALTDNRENVWLDIRDDNPYGIRHGLDIPSDLIPPIMSFNLRLSGVNFTGTPFRRYLDGMSDLMRMDALNIAYVGLTRAQTELNVYYEIDSNDTVGRALADAVSECVGRDIPAADNFSIHIPEGAFNRETKALYFTVEPSRTLTEDEIAEKRKKEDKESQTRAENEQRADFLTKDYISVVRPDMKALVSVESLERYNDSNLDDDSDEDLAEGVATNGITDAEDIFRRRSTLKNEKTQRGLDLHEILANMPYFESDDNFDTVFEDAFSKAVSSDGFIEENKEDYWKTVSKMLQRPEASVWFSPDARIDTELSYHQPWREDDKKDIYHLGRIHRIDRFVELPNGNINIIDYKFAGHKSSKYNEQVREYVETVQRIFTGREVRGYLWYVDLNIVEPV